MHSPVVAMDARRAVQIWMELWQSQRNPDFSAANPGIDQPRPLRCAYTDCYSPFHVTIMSGSWLIHPNTYGSQTVHQHPWLQLGEIPFQRHSRVGHRR